MYPPKAPEKECRDIQKEGIRMRSLCFCVAISALLLVLPNSDAQETSAESQIGLSLRLDTTEIVAYEPIHAAVILRNSSDKPVTVRVIFSIGLKFEKAYQGKPFVKCAEGSMSNWSLHMDEQLPPGATKVASNELLFFSREKGRDPEKPLIFNEPGEYKIRVRLNIRAGNLVSNIVKVTVKKLAPEDALAAELFTNRRAMPMISRGAGSDEGEAILRQLLTEYPQSSYADHAHFALGRYYNLQAYRKVVGAVAASLESFQSYSKVSDRIPALRLRALMRQAKLICDSAEVREIADIPKLVKELKDRADTAKAIGLQARATELREKLEALSESELKK